MTRGNKHDLDDALLEEAFNEARATPPLVPDGLMARVLADAEAELQGRNATGAGLFGQLWRALGGWPSVAGLAAAACAGLWIGVSPPAALDTALGVFNSETASDLDALGVYDVLLVEG